MTDERCFRRLHQWFRDDDVKLTNNGSREHVSKRTAAACRPATVLWDTRVHFVQVSVLVSRPKKGLDNNTGRRVVTCVISEIDVYLPSFSSHSYLEFAGRITSSLSTFTDIEVVFRSSSADGLLLYSGPCTPDLDTWPWTWPWPTTSRRLSQSDLHRFVACVPDRHLQKSTAGSEFVTLPWDLVDNVGANKLLPILRWYLARWPWPWPWPVTSRWETVCCCTAVTLVSRSPTTYPSRWYRDTSSSGSASALVQRSSGLPPA